MVRRRRQSPRSLRAAVSIAMAIAPIACDGSPGRVAEAVPEQVAPQRSSSGQKQDSNVSGPGGAESPCPAVCELSAKIGCPAPAIECQRGCQEMLAGPHCRGQMRAFMRCLKNEPPEHWECGDQGVAAIKAGFCDREQREYAVCLRTAAP